MTLTDTHTHMYVEEFREDRDAVMQRALEAGVERFFIPAIDSTYTRSMRELREAFPDRVFLMSGLHPTHVKEDYEQELEHVRTQLAQGGYVAVGEIGMDLYWDTAFREQQEDAFRQQIGMARGHGLPIVIHCREAFDEIFEVLESEKGPGLFGIFHCFTGTLEQAHRAISYGMKLGIGGVVTFKNGKIDTFLEQIPLEHIVLETDAPYLAPVPRRGKRNEPAYLRYVLARLSEIYGLPEAEIAAITTENSKAVFGV
ncbi:TatD family hydrolase [Robiginitalea sp. M366]|uniref:TatD family hydrolase n=1 Tax=Robiginitalea aestuariiviva TaxID=3036903 RepID=UPI00240E3758|nr:TatD family hydrolase [Robiginitalea aestuariiviva]MDG1571064.1 TatD family hydrolase [Robiginitalea aestuariiviva]